MKVVSSIQGIDFFIKKQFKNYNTWLAYSFNSANYNFPNLNNGRSFPSNVNITHTLKWSHFYKYKNIEFSLGWLLHSGKPYTQVETELDATGGISYNFNELNTENLPLYHRLDFAAVYDFRPHRNQKLKYRVGLSVLNLYNKKNLLNKDIRLNSQTNQLQVSDIIGNTITPNLTFVFFGSFVR